MARAAKNSTSSEKPRGRMSSYAFFVQKTREDFKKKHPSESVNFAEFSKKCSEQWKKMGDGEKKKFVQMAEKDRRRYDTEMTTYVPPKGEKKKGRKKKDPNAPKRAVSAFFWYCQDERQKVRDSLPSDKGVGDVAKELGKKWNALNPNAKSKYEALAAKDKVRYEKELAVYKAKGGAASGGSSGKSSAKKTNSKAKKQETVSESEDDDDDEDDDDEDDEDDDDDEDDE